MKFKNSLEIIETNVKMLKCYNKKYLGCLQIKLTPRVKMLVKITSTTCINEVWYTNIMFKLVYKAKHETFWNGISRYGNFTKFSKKSHNGN